MTESIIRRLPAAWLLFRYLVSGGTAATVNIGLLYVFTEKFGVWYLAASVLSFCCAFAVSFAMQKWWTFRDRGIDMVGLQLGLFLGVALVNLGLNTLLMYVFTDVLGIWYVLSQVLSSGLIAIESFIAYRLFIFKRQQADTNGQE